MNNTKTATMDNRKTATMDKMKMATMDNTKSAMMNNAKPKKMNNIKKPPMTNSTNAPTMNNMKWLNKEDSRQDLQLVTDQQGMPVTDNFSVVGQQPPPAHSSTEYDDQIMYLYGGEVNHDTMEVKKVTKPDLAGITHMLRMVNDFYETPSYNDEQNMKQMLKHANTEICISKLNPCAPDFTPKDISSYSFYNSLKQNGELVNSSNTYSSSSKDSNNEKLVCKDIDEVNISPCDNSNNICLEKRIDVSNLDPEDFKKIRDELKLKIISTSKDDSPKKKRDRNLAIANLMKLYSNVPESSPSVSQTMKSFPPKHFETPVEDNPKPKGDIEVKYTPPNVEDFQRKTHRHGAEETSPINHTNHMTNSGEICEKQVFNVEDINEQAVQKTTDVLAHAKQTRSQVSEPMSSTYVALLKGEMKNCDDDKDITLQSEVMAGEIKKSVIKVNNWLDGGSSMKDEKKTTPALYLGPVIFKRKEGNKPLMPSVDKSEKAAKYIKTNEYVPSAYASELIEKYTERQEVKVACCEGIWDKLDRELRERDEALKKKMKQNENPNQSEHS